MKRLSAATTALALAGLPLALTSPAYAVPGAPEETKIQLVLDSSGSMAAKDQAGRPKIEAARESLHKMTDSLSPQAQVGMRVYGATVKEEGPNGEAPPKACTDTQKVVDFGTNNRVQLHSAIDRYTPTGFTPTVQAIKAAVEDMGTTGKRQIVLVSDGEANCSPNPCDEIKAMQKSGVSFHVDTVGMSLGDKARAELKCIADATGGHYYEANNTEDLTKSLSKISKRALRDYDFQGQPVRGTADAANAPYLEPGQYLDESTGKDTKHYKIKVPQNQHVYFSALVRASSAEKMEYPALSLKMTDEKGRTCASTRFYALDQFGYDRPIVSDGLTYDPIKTARSQCPGAQELSVSVFNEKGNASSRPMPMELLVSSSPWLDAPLGRLGDGPYAATELYIHEPLPVDDRTVPALPTAEAATREVLGGAGFNSAVELQPGATSTTMLPGENQVYKVKLEWGQDAALMVDSPGENTVYTQVLSFGKERQRIAPKEFPDKVTYFQNLGGDMSRSNKIAAYIPPLRANNRFSGSALVNTATDPGYYYFVVNVGYPRTNGDVSVPLRLNLRVTDGPGKPVLGAGSKPGDVVTATPKATPIPNAATPTPQASVAPTDPKGGSKLPVIIGLGAAGLVVMVGGGVWLGSRLRG